VGEEEGHSFYSTRRAEYEWRQGNLGEARQLIDEAVDKTGKIFRVHLLRAEIYMDIGNKTVVLEEIETMDRMISRPNYADGRSNLRTVLQMRAQYLSSIGKFDDAKDLYRNNRVFTNDETAAAIKAIEYDQAYGGRS